MVCREKIKLRHINKEVQMLAEVIITNVHKHNFAFGHAVEPINEQVFIPSHVIEGIDLKPSDIVEATLVPNYADKSNSGTKYMAVKVSLLNTPELNMIDSVETSQEVDFNQVETETQDLTREQLDKLVLDFIYETAYCTTSEISQNLNIPHKSAGNSAMRAFSNGLISKAEVYGRVGLQRPTFLMWAKEANRFIDCD